MINRLISLLEESPITIHFLKRELGIRDTKTIIVYLKKVEHICKIKGWKFEIIPARCKKCGHIFEKKIGNPRKCPRCRSEWIEPPKFYIIKPK